MFYALIWILIDYIKGGIKHFEGSDIEPYGGQKT